MKSYMLSLVGIAVLWLGSTGVASEREWMASSGSLQNIHEEVRARAVDVEGNSYVAGVVFPAEGGPVYCVSKFDLTGALSWTARYQDPNFIGEGEITIEVDRTGSVTMNIAEKSSGRIAISAKYDQYGAMQWVSRNVSIANQNFDPRIAFEDFHPSPTDQIPYQAGWPYVQYISPLVFFIGQSIVSADFDPTSSEQEMLLCLMQDVKAWNHDGILMTGWPIDPDFNYRGASIAVQDGVGMATFASAESAGNVHMYQHTGIENTNWPIVTQGNISDSPVRADLDADSIPEIVAGGGGPNYRAFAWNPDGSSLPNWPVALSQNVTGMAVGDVNDDGELEVVCVSMTLWNKRVWVLSSGGEILSQWQPPSDAASECCPALADLDGDGDLEIILGGYGEVYCWHHDGNPYWPTTSLAGGDVSQIAIGDLEGDGSLEVVVCCSARLYVFNYDGTLHQGDWPFTLPRGSWVWSTPEHSGPVVGDIDGDGIQEIVVHGWCMRWIIAAFEPDGRLVRGFPTLEGDYDYEGSPVILDIDGDNDLEIGMYALSASLKVVVYDLPTPYNPEHIDWPMLQHDPQRTGCYGGGETARYVASVSMNSLVGDELVGNYSLHSPHPNPFNPTTTIRFDLPQVTWVKLDVFDIQGRSVGAFRETPLSLVNGWREAGSHEVTFDGSRLPSGIYVYRLQAGEFMASGKMVLLK